jgi:hypothetical protein
MYRNERRGLDRVWPECRRRRTDKECGCGRLCWWGVICDWHIDPNDVQTRQAGPTLWVIWYQTFCQWPTFIPHMTDRFDDSIILFGHGAFTRCSKESTGRNKSHYCRQPAAILALHLVHRLGVLTVESCCPYGWRTLSHRRRRIQWLSNPKG